MRLTIAGTLVAMTLSVQQRKSAVLEMMSHHAAFPFFSRWTAFMTSSKIGGSDLRLGSALVLALAVSRPAQLVVGACFNILLYCSRQRSTTASGNVQQELPSAGKLGCLRVLLLTRLTRHTLDSTEHRMKIILVDSTSVAISQCGTLVRTLL